MLNRRLSKRLSGLWPTKILAYSYFNKWFEINTNANNLPLGVVIIKERKKGFYSRKLTDIKKGKR